MVSMVTINAKVWQLALLLCISIPKPVLFTRCILEIYTFVKKKNILELDALVHYSSEPVTLFNWAVPVYTDVHCSASTISIVLKHSLIQSGSCDINFWVQVPPLF